MNTVVSGTSNSANLPADFSLVSHFFLLHPSLKAKCPRCSYFSLRDWIYPHGFNHQSCMDNYQLSIPALTFSWAPMPPSNTLQVGTVIRMSTHHHVQLNTSQIKNLCILSPHTIPSLNFSNSITWSPFFQGFITCCQRTNPEHFSLFLTIFLPLWLLKVQAVDQQCLIT